VPFDWLRAKIEFRTLSTGQSYEIGDVRVELIEQYHSHVSYGYRFTDAAGKSVVFSTDSEHKIETMARESHVSDFFRDVDLAICDTRYSLADSASSSTCAMQRRLSDLPFFTTNPPTRTRICSGCIRKASAMRN
jgi:hypothetical protein